MPERRDRSGPRDALKLECRLERAIERRCRVELRIDDARVARALRSLEPATPAPERIGESREREHAAGHYRTARERVERTAVDASSRPHSLVAVAKLFEDVNLLPEIIPDDVRIPPLGEGFYEVARVVVRPSRGLEWLRAARRRRVEGSPGGTLRIIDVHLDPRVRVAFADGVVAAESVPRAAHEAGHVP